MVTSIREAQSLLGVPSYGLTHSQVASRMLRRSLLAIKEIKKGEALIKGNIHSIRLGNGLAQKHLTEIIRKTSEARLSLR